MEGVSGRVIFLFSCSGRGGGGAGEEAQREEAYRLVRAPGGWGSLIGRRQRRCRWREDFHQDLYKISRMLWDRGNQEISI